VSKPEFDASISAERTEAYRIVDEMLGAEPVPPKGHRHFKIQTLCSKFPICEQLLRILHRIIAPWLAAGYRVDACEVIKRAANLAPMHRDKRTGKGMFGRARGLRKGVFHAHARPALRLLIELTGDGGRYMRYEIRNERDEVVRAFVTSAALVFMTACSAGSALGSNIWHGRFGDGYTVSIDLALVALPCASRAAFAAAKFPAGRGNGTRSLRILNGYE
jgi:hypothetical protein